MSGRTQGVVLFADDVREEVGGKFSVMGVLGPECWVTDERINLVCMFLLWAVEPDVTIAAKFRLENAPKGTRVPAAFERTLRKHPDDQADTWLIQMTGRLRVKVGEKPLVIKATFRVGQKLFSNKIVMEYDRSKSAQIRMVSPGQVEA